MTPLNEPSIKKSTANFSNVAIKPDVRPELLLRLSGKLQTTLELSQLLEIFFKEAKHCVAIDGLGYDFPKQGVLLMQGRLAPHKARYSLQTSDSFMGDLTFYCRRKIREFELANLEGLMSTLVYPLRNALQYKSALDASYRDPLTGVNNRAALNKVLERDIRLAKRHKQGLSILMMDLDHFKSINDLYGHTVGDEVLQKSAKAIGDCIRETDVCFRYGGEEFLVLLNNASHEDTLDIAKRIRKSIECMKFKSRKGDFNITTSIGCATLQAQDNAQRLIERADEMLYSAKNQGRNQVIIDDTQSLIDRISSNINSDNRSTQ